MPEQEMSRFLENLRREFLQEALQQLDECDEAYLALSDPERRPKELDRIFRAAHSIKGSGLSVGFEDIGRFAHVLEDLLNLLRATPDRCSEDVISILFESGDAIRRRLSMYIANDESAWSTESLVHKIKIAIEVVSRAAPASEPEHKGFELWDDPTPAKATTELPEAKASTAKPAGRAMIKVDVDRVERLLDIVGELTVLKSQLMNETAAYAANSRLESIVSLLDATMRDLQEKTMAIRMTGMKPLFLKMQRLVRDLAIQLDKPVNLVISGEDTELDRTLVEKLSDPLTHMVRNAMDHGVETKTARALTAKSAVATIHLAARQSGTRVVITVEDDGRGIDAGRIHKKAVERGLTNPKREISTFSEKEIFAFLFAPGFSTAERVTGLSGRGVGMDVVRSNIESMKGAVEVQSQFGKGTRFTISVPLTTSVTDGLLVSAEGEQLIIPLERIKELVEVPLASNVRFSSEYELVQVREDVLQVFPLARSLRGSTPGTAHRISSIVRPEKQLIVVVEFDGHMFGLAVDAVHGQTQVVLKPLSHLLPENISMAGASILGDGRVVLVLDAEALFRSLHGVLRRDSIEHRSAG